MFIGQFGEKWHQNVVSFDPWTWSLCPRIYVGDSQIYCVSQLSQEPIKNVAHWAEGHPNVEYKSTGSLYTQHMCDGFKI